MPRGFENRELASASGKASKRGPSSNVELLRSGITGKIDINELFFEIGEMELNDRVNAKIKLLGYVLPRLAAIDLTASGEMTVTQFISLNSSEQDQFLETLVNGKNGSN